MSIICSVCQTQKNDYISDYLSPTGSFLNATTLRQCQFCQFVFANPMPSDQSIDDYYKNSLYYDGPSPFSEEFLTFSYRLAQSRLRLIFKYITLMENDRVLDIGAGNAALGIALKDMAPQASYDAVEPSDKCINQWGNQVSNSYRNLSEASIGAYRVITLCQVLEHVNNPLAFLKNIATYIIPDGVLLIDVPYRDDLFKPIFDPHLLFWEKDTLAQVAKNAGFEPLFCDSVGMKRNQARKYFKQPQTLVDKISDSWRWRSRINKGMMKFGSKALFDTFIQFQADAYGGERHWLRCIARKI